MKSSEYPPVGRFVISHDAQGSTIRHPFWQLDAWLYRYTEYPTMPPNMWLRIPGEGLCLFQPYDYAKYLEKTSTPERKKSQSESQRRDENIAKET